MVTLLLISRHTPADCALYNEKAAKIVAEGMTKIPGLQAKHGVKTVGSWTVHSEHLSVSVYEAPSFEAFQAYAMEPEILPIWNLETTEIKIAVPFEEVSQIIQQMVR